MAWRQPGNPLSFFSGIHREKRQKGSPQLPPGHDSIQLQCKHRRMDNLPKQATRVHYYHPLPSADTRPLFYSAPVQIPRENIFQRPCFRLWSPDYCSLVTTEPLWKCFQVYNSNHNQHTDTYGQSRKTSKMRTLLPSLPSA